jgi:hypothetical protein
MNKKEKVIAGLRKLGKTLDEALDNLTVEQFRQLCVQAGMPENRIQFRVKEYEKFLKRKITTNRK